MEPSTLKRQHTKAIGQAAHLLCNQTGRDAASFQGFELYTLRHTYLTRWAAHTDPWTPAYLAGPREQAIRAAMERARGAEGGHTSQNLNPGKTATRPQPP